MTKRLTAWVLTLALVLSAVPVVISAEGTSAPHSHSAAQHLCEHCSAAAEWTAWESGTALPATTGHYYLTGDVQLSAGVRIETGQDVVLCLNGYNVTGGLETGKSFSMFDLRGKLTVSDCTAYTDAEGVLHAGKIQKGYRTDSGGAAFWVYKSNAVLKLYDVIVCDHSSTYATSAWGGGAVYVRDKATVELTGCLFCGNTTAAEGGAVMVRENAVLIARDTTFTGNTAKTGGSAIYSPSAGNITLQDCTITDNNFSGTDKSYKGAVYSASASDKLTISGATVIDNNFAGVDGTKREQNIYLQRATKTPVDIGGLTDGAKISIRTHWGTETTPTMVTAAAAPVDWYFGYVLYENNGKAIDYSTEDGFHFVSNDIHAHCTCGEAACGESGHEEVEYKPWKSTTALPTSGAYYLTDHVKLAGETGVTGDLQLCLNGFSVTAAEGKQIITTPKGTDLTITISDCTAAYVDGVYTAGKLQGGVDQGKGRGGGAIFIRDEGDLKIFDGIFTGNTSDLGGGAIRLGANATLTMFDGEISNNTALNGTTYKTGGAISAITGSTVTIAGGTIKNNRGGNGGAIFSQGTVNITGGTITGNTGEKGGAIYVEGGLKAENAAITGNTATYGGAVYVEKGKSAVLTDSVIRDNSASGVGAAAIYVNSATLTLNGCTMTGNRASNAGGSAVYSPGSSTITLKNTEITDNLHAGKATDCRGAVYTSGTGDKLILIGNVVIRDNLTAVDGTAVERNIYLQRKPNTAIDVGGLTAGTELTVYTHWGEESEPTMVKADKAPTAWVRGWIVYDNNEMAVDYDATQNKFFFTINADHVHCVCGAGECTDSTHALVGYKAWSDTAALPTVGKYYLTVDVNLAGETGLTGDLDLCLHGHTVTAAKDKQIITTPNNRDLTLTISDCTAGYENGAYKAGKLTGGVEKASLGRGGGAIYIRAEGNLKLYDGIITGNTSGTGGGAIRLGKNASFIMYDGEISNNTAVNGTTYRTGGAISAITGTDVQLLGGTIKNNCGGNGGAVYAEGKLTVGDCEITGNTTTVNGGGVHVTSGGIITLSGAPVIWNNLKDSTANNLYLAGNVTMNVDGLDSKAHVGVSAEKAFRAISGQCPDVSARVTSDRTNLQVIYRDSALYLGAADGHTHCLCVGISKHGCTHQGTAFAAWDSTTSIPKSGNWYLTADIDLQESVTLNTEELNLCLNGHRINLDGCKQGRLIYLKGTSKLSITDCTEEPGTISGAAQSAVQFENNKAAAPVLCLYNGVFTNNTSIHGGGGAVLLQGSGTFHMYGGKLTGNYIEAAAKVDADGNPVLSGSGVQQVTNQLGGGAVCVYGTNATINIYGGEISNNRATACQRLNADGSYSTVGGYGGAIYTESDINIYGGTFTGNNGLDGGAIYATTGTMLTMQDGLISGNTAVRNGGGAYLFRNETVLQGGSITENRAGNSGGGVMAKGVTLQLAGTNITGNTANQYGGGLRVTEDIRNGERNPNKVTLTVGAISGNTSNTAGGILLEGRTSQLVMTGGEISGNTATGTAGGAYISTGTVLQLEGGKIADNRAKTGAGMRLYKSTANLKGGVITGNRSSSNAGGIYATYRETVVNLQGTEISNNYGQQAGGILLEDRATMNFSSGTVKDNTAQGGGGGIYVSVNSNLNMTGGTVTGNQAASGAGLYCYRGNLTLAGGNISYNTAEKGGGGIQASGGSLTFKGTNLIGNKVTNGYGGGIRATGAVVKKNGVSTVYPSTTYMYGGAISNNSANGGGGVLLEQTDSAWYMYGGTISDNEATGNGGGIFASKVTNLNVLGGKIRNNTARVGGGVYHLQSAGVYKNCEISENSAIRSGGAVVASAKCGVDMENVRIIRNSNTAYGGAVYLETDVPAVIKNSLFEGNSGNVGGAVFANCGAKLVITDTVFTGNTATKCGGALTAFDTATITNCVFTNNSAVRGGAIYTGDESSRIACNGWGMNGKNVGLKITGCELRDNEATEQGGGLYMFMSCYGDVQNTTFTGNSAGQQGGAIWSAENLTMTDLIITGNKTEGNGGAVYLAEAEYDGHSYIRGTMKLSGDMLITENEGGDLYLAKDTTLAISAAGLGQNAKFGVILDSGLLTQRLFGSYDYEGGECVYTVTYGDRSLTDPEYDPSMAVKTETEAESAQPDETRKTDTWLYIGIGIVAVAIITAVALLLMKKKKSAGAESK